MSQNTSQNTSTNKKAVVLLSGGMDSATLLHTAMNEGANEIIALSFNYGQRHQKELEYAHKLAVHADLSVAVNMGGHVHHRIIDLRSITGMIPGSALTDQSVDVPHGHYADENMKSTVVPNRNPVMLSIAFAVASANQYDLVGAAFHAGDHPIYPR